MLVIVIKFLSCLKAVNTKAGGKTMIVTLLQSYFNYNLGSSKTSKLLTALLIYLQNLFSQNFNENFALHNFFLLITWSRIHIKKVVNHSAGQEVLHLLQSFSVWYYVHKNPQLDPILGHMNSVHTNCVTVAFQYKSFKSYMKDTD